MPPGGTPRTLSATDFDPPARRGVWASLLFALGVVLGGVPAWHSALLFAGAAGLAGLAALRRGLVCRVALGLAVVCAGAGYVRLRAHEHRSDSLAHLLTSEPLRVELVGMVATAPERRGEAAHWAGAGAGPPLRFTVQARALIDSRGGARAVTGDLWTRADALPDGVRAGDVIVIDGGARAIGPPMNPGADDLRPWAAQQGIVGSLNAERVRPASATESRLTWADRNAARLLRAQAAVRDRLGGWLEDGPNDDPARALLASLLLGERDRNLEELEHAMTRLGLAHVLAISGMNLAILAWVVTALVRLTGERPRLEPLLVIAAVAAYAFAVPVRAPILRAAIVIVAWYGADLFGRRYDRLNVLGWAYLLVLLWRPLEVFSVGCQLSFGVVAALLTLAGPTRERLFGAPPERDTVGWLRALWEMSKDLVAATIVAWAVSAPLIADRVGMVSWLAIPVTLLVGPLFTVLIGAGYAMVVLSAIWPAGAEAAAPLLRAPAEALGALVLALDGTTWNTWFTPRFGVAWTVCATMAAVWWLRRGSLRRWGGVLASAIVVAWTVLEARPGALPRETAARIDTFSLGDSVCHLVRAGGDRVLYDCGAGWSGGARDVLRALRELGAHRIETVVISTPLREHALMLPELIEPLGVRRLLVSRAVMTAAENEPSGAAANALRAARRHGVKIEVLHAGEQVMIGPASLHVLAPGDETVFARTGDASLVCRLETATDAGDRVVLFTGSIHDEGVARLEARDAPLGADVIEAPAFGAWSRGRERLIENSGAGTMIVPGSAGAPDSRWNSARRGAMWLETGRTGAVTVTISADGTVSAQGYLEGPGRPS